MLDILIWILIILGLIAIALLGIPSKTEANQSKRKLSIFSFAFLVASVLALAYLFHGMRTCNGDWCGVAYLFYGGGAAIGLVIIALVVAIFARFRKN